MAGERKVTTNEAGELLIKRLNKLVVHCDGAIENLLGLNYRFPSDIQSTSQDEMDGNDLVRLVRNSMLLVDDAVDEYKRTLSDYLIAKALPPKQPEQLTANSPEMLEISVNQPVVKPKRHQETKQIYRAHHGGWWALLYLPIRLYEPKGGDSYG